MGALLKTKKYNDTRTWNTFNRKIIDFVILDSKLNVQLIIELDDSSHKYKGQKDKERDMMLQSAGYRTLRFSYIPSVEQLQTTFQALEIVAGYKKDTKIEKDVQKKNTHNHVVSEDTSQAREETNDEKDMLAQQLKELSAPGIVIVSLKASYIRKINQTLSIRSPQQLYYKYLYNTQGKQLLARACQNIGWGEITLDIQYQQDKYAEKE